MKNCQFVIIAIIAMMFAAFTSQAQTFEVRYNVDDFSVVKKNDSVFTVKTAVKHFYSSDKSAPQLPYLSANILRGENTRNGYFSDGYYVLHAINNEGAEYSVTIKVYPYSY